MSKRIKRVLALTVALTLMALSVACGQACGKKRVVSKYDQGYFDSFESLVKRADYIVRGEVLSKYCDSRSLRIPSEFDEVNGNYDAETVITVYSIKVNESYTSSCESGALLDILVEGGETDKVIHICEEAPEFSVGSEYVFFLSQSRLFKNSAWLLNFYQSAYLVDAGEVRSGGFYGFEITFDTLESIKRNESGNGADS